MRIIISLFALLVAAPAFATDPARSAQVGQNGCYEFLICDALAADGDCNWAGYLPGYSHTLYAETSTEESFTCTMRSARAWSATVYGVTDPAITVTEAVEVQPFDALLHTYWLNCAGIDGGDDITVYDYVCPLTK